MKRAAKIAIITGGGTGIGKAIAKELALIGFIVIVCGRRVEVLLDTVEEINTDGGMADYCLCDVTKDTSVIEMVEYVISKYNTVDILVNNAGAAKAGVLVEFCENDWNKIIDTNLKGTYLCCKSVIPIMLKQKSGYIFNISSILGLHGAANFVAYCAAKSGLIGFSQALAEELKPNGISVHVICPGRTNTDMQITLGGSTVAALSMPPERVAKLVIEIIENKLGSSPVILVKDDQSELLNLYELIRRIKWILRRVGRVVTKISERHNG